MKEILTKLLAHMRWADALFAEALITADRADEHSVRLFAHVASAEHLWYCRIIGRQPSHAVWPTLSPAAARDLAAEHADLFERLVSKATDGDLSRAVPYTNSAGNHYESALADIVTHVAQHGSHHRGQIAARIRQSGTTPPYTDFIQFTRRDQHS